MLSGLDNTAHFVVVCEKQEDNSWKTSIKLPMQGSGAFGIFGSGALRKGKAPLDQILPIHLRMHHRSRVNWLLNTDMYKANGELDPMWKAFIGHDHSVAQKEFSVLPINHKPWQKPIMINLAIAPLKVGKGKFKFQLTAKVADSRSMVVDKCAVVPASVQVAPAITKSLHYKSIMLVDDRDISIMILLRHLGIKFTPAIKKLYTAGGGLLREKVGDIEVIIANDGKTALAYYEYYKPDLIVTDVHMPEVRGDEMIQEIESKYKDHNVQYLLNSNADLTEKLSMGFTLAKNPATRFEFVTLFNLPTKMKNIATAAKKDAEEKHANRREMK